MCETTHKFICTVPSRRAKKVANKNKARKLARVPVPKDLTRPQSPEPTKNYSPPTSPIATPKTPCCSPSVRSAAYKTSPAHTPCSCGPYCPYRMGCPNKHSDAERAYFRRQVCVSRLGHNAFSARCSAGYNCAYKLNCMYIHEEYEIAFFRFQDCPIYTCCPVGKYCPFGFSCPLAHSVDDEVVFSKREKHWYTVRCMYGSACDNHLNCTYIHTAEEILDFMETASFMH
eukprot:Rmarinus@m.10493